MAEIDLTCEDLLEYMVDPNLEGLSLEAGDEDEETGLTTWDDVELSCVWYDENDEMVAVGTARFWISVYTETDEVETYEVLEVTSATTPDGEEISY